MDFIEGDFLENSLKDLTGLPDQDAQLSNQILNDPQWYQEIHFTGKRRKEENCWRTEKIPEIW